MNAQLVDFLITQMSFPPETTSLNQQMLVFTENDLGNKQFEQNWQCIAM